MGHDGVACHRHGMDIVPIDAGFAAEKRNELIDALDQYAVNILAADRHGVVHAGHDIAAVGDLRIFQASRQHILLADIIVEQGHEIRGPQVKRQGIGAFGPDVNKPVPRSDPSDDARERLSGIRERRKFFQDRQRNSEGTKPDRVLYPLVMCPAVVIRRGRQKDGSFLYQCGHGLSLLGHVCI